MEGKAPANPSLSPTPGACSADINLGRREHPEAKDYESSDHKRGLILSVTSAIRHEINARHVTPTPSPVITM